MNNYSLFTDASLNPMRKVGVGGYIFVSESFVKNSSSRINISELNEILVLRRFEDTSSTKLEVQTVLWALEEYCIRSAGSESGRLHLYSDSQCVEGLLSRRVRLESSGFQCRRGSRLLKNASLYRQYYEFHDRLKFDVTKVAGHTPSHSRNTIERIFSVIDQKVRKEVKLWMAELEGEKAKKQSGIRPE